MFHAEELNPVILRSFQQILHYVNPYVDGFKSCRRRLKKTENTNPTMQMVIKMADPTKQNWGTHNHPTSTEVAGILIGKDELYGNNWTRYYCWDKRK